MVYSNAASADDEDVFVITILHESIITIIMKQGVKVLDYMGVNNNKLKILKVWLGITLGL